MARATRLKLLVDGEACFGAFRSAALGARHSILILGWDLDGRMVLDPSPLDGLPADLEGFLGAIMMRRPNLRIHLLIWAGSPFYALERQWRPLHNLDDSESRLELVRDSHHPTMAAHHQKMVIVDGDLALTGGIDLSRNRWDTTAHLLHDPARRGVHGEEYRPFHDLQWLLTGEAARSLEELARQRWHRATEKWLPVTPPVGTRETWPPGLEPDLEDVEVGISRTDPEHQGRPAVRELEKLHVDALNAAKRCIYIENQYFSSTVVADVLVRRLQEPGGPEVLAVLPHHSRRKMEQRSIDVLRNRTLRRIQAADVGGRFKVYWARAGHEDEEGIMIHGKVLVVDDRLLHVGSANLNNRGFGMDTECGISVEGRCPRTRSYILHNRNRLLAEHLGRREEEVAEAVEAHGSCLAAVESLRGPGRSLEPLAVPERDEFDRQIPDDPVFDPARPLRPDSMVDRVVPTQGRKSGLRKLLTGLSWLVMLGGLVLVFSLSPLRGISIRAFSAWDLLTPPVEPVTLLSYLGVFSLAALLGAPLMVLATIAPLLLGFMHGFLISLGGALLSGWAGFGIGRLLGWPRFHRITGGRLGYLKLRLAGKGILDVAVTRAFPVAPFTAVNMLTGSAGVTMRDFSLGTLLGLTPGLLVLAWTGSRLAAVMDEPSGGNIALLLMSLLVVVGTMACFARLLARRRRAGREEAP